MNLGRTVFSQLVNFLPTYQFQNQEKDRNCEQREQELNSNVTAQLRDDQPAGDRGLLFRSRRRTGRHCCNHLARTSKFKKTPYSYQCQKQIVVFEISAVPRKSE